MNIVISILIFILGLAMFFWMNRDKKHFRFDIDEVHHAYYGWLILWIAPLHLRLLRAGALFTGMMLVGIVLVWDDIYQHHRQAREPDYQSPLHKLLRFFRWVW